jgi:L,D-peptidoglycan transpeptidase YkuD (ErfK/YbiS/YcfS/YnhG family)
MKMPRPVTVALSSAALITVAALSVCDGQAPANAGQRLASAETIAAVRPLPARMAATGGGTQLITAVTRGRKNSSRDGVLTWWQRKGKRWVKVGSTPARFGVNGLSGKRLEGDGTTPTGLFSLPLAFGIDADPGTKMPWHQVDSRSWWDENAASSRYNTWYENCPKTVCWKSSSEHLASYRPQYDYAVFIGFNIGKKKVRAPKRPSGSGIFLHVFGSGHTAGCVSVRKSALVSILRWLDPDASPHIAIGNTRTIYRY